MERILHPYIVLEHYDIDGIDSIKISSAGHWLYALDGASLLMYDFFVKQMRCHAYNQCEKLMVCIGNKKTIVNYCRGRRILESLDIKLLVKRFWEFCDKDSQIPDVLQYVCIFIPRTQLKELPY